MFSRPASFKVSYSRGERALFPTALFSEESERFPPDSGERRGWADGKLGIEPDPRATRLTSSSRIGLGTDFKVRFSGLLDGTACPRRLEVESGRLTTLRFRGLPQNVLFSRPGSATLLDLR